MPEILHKRNVAQEIAKTISIKQKNKVPDISGEKDRNLCDTFQRINRILNEIVAWTNQRAKEGKTCDKNICKGYDKQPILH